MILAGHPFPCLEVSDYSGEKEGGKEGVGVGQGWEGRVGVSRESEREKKKKSETLKTAVLGLF